MIHPNTELKIVSEEIGLGVFAKSDIPHGTIVYVKDPLEIIISQEQFEELPDIVKTKADIYSYIESDGSRILSWDSAKFVNHSCDANTLSTGYGFEIAIRDIKAGEEITDDYGMFNIPTDMKLYCECKNCRKMLRSSDFKKHVPYWDKQVQEALVHLRKVDQPLLDLIPTQTSLELFEYLNTGKNYRSVSCLEVPRTNDDETQQTAKVHSLKAHRLKKAS